MRAAIQSKYRADTTSATDGLLSTSDLENKKQLSGRSITLIALSFYFLIGYAYYGTTQNMDFLTSTYFSVVTMMTIGYGDFHAEPNDPSELFTCFFVLLVR